MGLFLLTLVWGWLVSDCLPRCYRISWNLCKIQCKNQRNRRLDTSAVTLAHNYSQASISLTNEIFQISLNISKPQSWKHEGSLQQSHVQHTWAYSCCHLLWGQPPRRSKGMPPALIHSQTSDYNAMELISQSINFMDQWVWLKKKKKPINFSRQELEKQSASTIAVGAAPLPPSATPVTIQVLPRLTETLSMEEHGPGESEDRTLDTEHKPGTHRKSRAAMWGDTPAAPCTALLPMHSNNEGSNQCFKQ